MTLQTHTSVGNLRSLRVFFAALCVCGVLLTLSQTEARGEATRLTRLTGWVVDDEAGKNHANDQSAAEIRKAFERGIKIVFYNPEKDSYHELSDPEAALQFAGKKMMILANQDRKGKLTVGNWRPAKTP